MQQRLSSFMVISLTFSSKLSFAASFSITHKQHPFPPIRSVAEPQSSFCIRMGRSKLAAISPLGMELESWASSSGYGTITSSVSIGSSDWSSFHKVTTTSGGAFFVKSSSSRRSEEMFHGEALALQAMYACSTFENANDVNEDSSSSTTLRIPKVYAYGDYSNGSKGSYLIMDYLNMGGRFNDEALGKAIARMHLAPATEKAGNPTNAFGFTVDNTIGGTPQPNPWTIPNRGTTEWIDFFRIYRIGHQLHLANDEYCNTIWENDIKPKLHLLFDDLQIRPSLIHGDLWSGNIGSADGQPSIFDPASYWGHHEAEWGVSIYQICVNIMIRVSIILSLCHLSQLILSFLRASRV